MLTVHVEYVDLPDVGAAGRLFQFRAAFSGTTATFATKSTRKDVKGCQYKPVNGRGLEVSLKHRLTCAIALDG